MGWNNQNLNEMSKSNCLLLCFYSNEQTTTVLDGSSSRCAHFYQRDRLNTFCCKSIPLKTWRLRQKRRFSSPFDFSDSKTASFWILSFSTNVRESKQHRSCTVGHQPVVLWDRTCLFFHCASCRWLRVNNCQDWKIGKTSVFDAINWLFFTNFFNFSRWFLKLWPAC